MSFSQKPERDYRQRMVKRIAALIAMAMRNRYAPSVPELAKQHGVCERTIRRDLEAIEACVELRWRVLQ